MDLGRGIAAAWRWLVRAGSGTAPTRSKVEHRAHEARKAASGIGYLRTTLSAELEAELSRFEDGTVEGPTSAGRAHLPSSSEQQALTTARVEALLGEIGTVKQQAEAMLRSPDTRFLLSEAAVQALKRVCDDISRIEASARRRVGGTDDGGAGPTGAPAVKG